MKCRTLVMESMKIGGLGESTAGRFTTAQQRLCRHGRPHPRRVSLLHPSKSLLINHSISYPPRRNNSIIPSLHPLQNKTYIPCRQTNPVTVRFKAVGRAPILVDAKQRGQIGSDQKFGTLANHLRRQLKLKASESLVIPP
jgi:hypothetical protein